MPLTRIDSAFLDLDAIGGIDFDVQSGVPTLSVDATNRRVGIGTNSPAEKLEVYGNARFKQTDGSHGIEFYPDVAGLGFQRIISFNRTSTAYEDLSIGVNNFVVTTGSADERLRIKSDGNVGIGTNNPQEKLEVTGKILYSNVYSAEGDLPSASTYHGMFAHVHGTGKGYFAHAGNWVKLLDENGGSLSGALTSTSSGSFTSLSTGASGVGVNISTNTISGPATLTLDPAAVGDNTGTVVIAGNLQVDGTTTTINSTTLTVDDKNIMLASGAANAAAADGAGIEIDGADATLLYKATPDAWVFNKSVGIGTDDPGGKLEIKGSGGSTGLTFRGTDSSGNTNFWVQDGGRVGVHYFPFVINQDYNDTATPSSTYFYVHGSSPFIIKSDGKVGIGTNNPSDKLSIYAAPNSLILGAKDSTRGNHIFQLLADDAPGNGELRLYKNSGSGTHEKTVQIQSSGDSYFTGGAVGIGTDDPSSHSGLHIIGSSYWPILVKTTSTGGGGVAVKDKDDTTSLYVGTGGSAWLTNSVTTDGLIRAQNNIIFGSNGNNERMRIASNGNVGIGTNTPLLKLDVRGGIQSVGSSISSAAQWISATGDNSAYDNMKVWYTGYNGGSPRLYISPGTIPGSGTTNTYVHLQNRTSGGAGTNKIGLKVDNNIEAGTYFGIANVGGSIAGSGGTENWIGTKTFGGDWALITKTHSATSSVIGNVGIGTTNPLEKLQIYNSAGSGAQIQFHDNSTGTANSDGLRVGYNGSGGQMWLFEAGYIRFATANSEKLRITSDGKVGIGTNNPDELLEVGNGTAVGGLKVSGQSIGITDEGLTFDWVSSGNAARFFSESAGDSIIQFYTTSSGTRGERLRITSDGKVGVGTDNPQVLVQLGSRTSATPQGALDVVRGEAIGGGTGPNIRLVHGPDGGTQRTHSIYSFVGNLRIAADSSEDLELHTGGSVTLIAGSNKNVGIGTNSPTEKLHVKGGRIRQTGPGYTNLGEGNYYCAPASRSIAPSQSKTITISGLQSGWATLRGGGYSSAGQSQFSFMYHFGGYMTATHTYDVHTVREWGNGVTITTSKSASSFTITLQNNSSSYTLSVNMFLETSSSNVILASN